MEKFRTRWEYRGMVIVKHKGRSELSGVHMVDMKPNILFVLADDLGWGDVGYHGSEIRTPNLDRLRDSGVGLEHHYVCPMCTPTRACLLTGRHPGRFGRHATVPSNQPVLPDGYRTLASYLGDVGYDTGLFGKWHLGSSPCFAPNRYGFRASYGSLAGGVDPYNHFYKRGPYSATWHRNGELVDERGHVTDLITREAVKWIESRTRPWFCYVPFTAVHVPVKAPQAWMDRYEYGRYDDDGARDRSFKKYAAYTSHMDSAVGDLLEVVSERCDVENTIVVFSSDNGAIPRCNLDGVSRYPGLQEETPRLGSNLPLRGQKAQLYEGGIRTPTVISWPGVLEPGSISHPMHIVDWMPTFTSMMGCPQDPLWDGVDMWPVISGEREHVERSLFWNFRGSEFAFMEGGWKLISTEGGSELFNIDSDPYETKDLAEEKPEIVERMAGRIQEERKLDDTSKRPDVDD
jgi:arylsulfatase A-like enzyme